MLFVSAEPFAKDQGSGEKFICIYFFFSFLPNLALFSLPPRKGRKIKNYFGVDLVIAFFFFFALLPFS